MYKKRPEPISWHWPISIPPENISKLKGSDVFRKNSKRPVAWNEFNILSMHLIFCVYLV